MLDYKTEAEQLLGYLEKFPTSRCISETKRWLHSKDFDQSHVIHILLFALLIERTRLKLTRRE